MPLYDYLCANCGKTCEILQKVNETQSAACPHCGKAQLKRQVSAPRFQLKGSGWYETDFKTKPQSKTSDKTTDNTSDKKEETPPPAKPEPEKKS